ncbi:MAG: NAD-dependent epimerase/dehydratase [Moraxellaceae bacterium]|jgi:UDP-glucose 4-epimerase|nr:NAD-dependent epimerase/dehydratase [Moraxellaceae bacterium]
MKILITGATGFIGSRLLTQAAQRFGTENVIALCSRPIAGHRCLVYHDHGLDGLPAADLAGIEVLVHAGAFTPKSAREANDVAGCNGNIAFTTRLLGLGFTSLKRIVFTSTLDVYDSAPLISESTPTLPATLYGLSKLYGERLVEIAGRERGIEVQILRIGHVYGPGEEKYQKMLPLTLRNVLLDAPVEIFGEGDELRSFIYIDDVIAAVLAAVTMARTQGPINVVGGSSISIRHLVEKIVALSGKPARIVQRESSHARRDLVFDNRVLRQTLLTQETALDEGLEREYRYMQALLGQRG